MICCQGKEEKMNQHQQAFAQILLKIFTEKKYEILDSKEQECKYRVQFLHKCNMIWTYERNILSGLLEPSIRNWLWDQAWHWKIAWPSFWRQKLLIGVLSKSLQSRLDYEMSRSLASRSCVTGWSQSSRKVSWWQLAPVWWRKVRFLCDL